MFKNIFKDSQNHLSYFLFFLLLFFLHSFFFYWNNKKKTKKLFCCFVHLSFEESTYSTILRIGFGNEIYILYYIVWLNKCCFSNLYSKRNPKSLHYCTLGCKHHQCMSVKKMFLSYGYSKDIFICVYINKYFKPVSTIEWSITSSTIVQRSIIHSTYLIANLLPCPVRYTRFPKIYIPTCTGKKKTQHNRENQLYHPVKDLKKCF